MKLTAGAASETAMETSPTGPYGVALAKLRLSAGTGLSGTPTDHLLGVFLCAPAITRHTMAGKRSYHASVSGSLCVCPAGADYTTEYDGPVHGVVLRVSPECLALAGAQLDRPGARLIEQMNGRDSRLCDMATAMTAEASQGHPNGALGWSSMTDALLRHLAEKHFSSPAVPLRGALSASTLRRLDGFIQENLHVSIDLATLAAVVGCDRYHFAHRFRAAVGVSPYRYVVRRRLQRAFALLQAGQHSIADIAATTGFADQSHLTRWVRRAYGTTPARLLA